MSEPFHNELKNVDNKMSIWLEGVRATLENDLRTRLNSNVPYSEQNLKAYINNFVQEIRMLCKKSLKERFPTAKAVARELLIPRVWRGNEDILASQIINAARALASNLIESNTLQREKSKDVEELCVKAVSSKIDRK